MLQVLSCLNDSTGVQVLASGAFSHCIANPSLVTDGDVNAVSMKPLSLMAPCLTSSVHREREERGAGLAAVRKPNCLCLVFCKGSSGAWAGSRLSAPVFADPVHFLHCPLQDMQVTGVEDDSRALNIVIHKPASSPHSKPFPILQATFVFSDHIRCIIAKQRLAKGRIQARRMKMQRIAGTGLVLLLLSGSHWASLPLANWAGRPAFSQARQKLFFLLTFLFRASLGRAIVGSQFPSYSKSAKKRNIYLQRGESLRPSKRGTWHPCTLVQCLLS